MKWFFILAIFFFSSAAFAMVNPASVYCSRHGGLLQIMQGSIGICIFPDQSYCEEWSFIRGRCLPGQHFLPKKKPGTHYCVKHFLRSYSIGLCKNK